MKSIKEIENTTILNKSKFITNLYRVDNINEIEIYLSNIKTKYKDATHYCYGYIIDNIKRFNDDGEPNGTAGMPILSTLEKNDLNHVLCIVTRYFGGIKLGAGPLTRAYSTSVSNAINKTNIIEIVNGYKINIIFTYNYIKDIDNILANYKITNKSFNDSIIYEAIVDDNVINKLKEKNVKYNIINNIFIEKKI